MSKSKPLAYVMSDDRVTVLIAGRPVTVNKSSGNFPKVCQAIREDDWDNVAKLADTATLIRSFSEGKLKVKDNRVYYDDTECTGYIVDKILKFVKEGIDAHPLLCFLSKLMENPSKRCVDQLFKFLEHGNMPVDPDGDFYAYKAVTSNWKDKHSGKFDNKLGKTVKMTRNQVDDDPKVACSHGLHVGSLGYVKSFAGGNDKILIVKVNPKDVVAVPKKEDSKLRCCKYKVISEFTDPLPDTTYGTTK
jgi:hypothetical protein